MSNSLIWPIDRTLSGAFTLGQSGPRNDGNEVVLSIPQSSSITRASASDCLMSYPEHSVVVVMMGSYSFIEMQSAYSTAAANWDNSFWAHLVRGKFCQILSLPIERGSFYLPIWRVKFILEVKYEKDLLATLFCSLSLSKSKLCFDWLSKDR